MKEAQDARAQRTKITADMVVQELALHAFGRMGDFYSDTGRMLEVHEMPPEVQARLSSIKFTRERTHRTGDGVDETTVEEAMVEVKLWDKLSALTLLGRHLGMFKDKVEHQADFSLLDALRRIEAREDEVRQRRPPSRV